MTDVGQILETMGLEQCLLAFVFLGSYAVAMGELLGARGRHYAAMTSLLSAIGFIGFARSLEEGVILVALALVGMGLFAGAVWALWTAATWRERQAARVVAPTAVSVDQPKPRRGLAPAALT